MGTTAVRQNGLGPERSYQQRMLALERANHVRSARAELKRDAKAGRADLLGVLASPPPELETMKVFDLLLAVPRFGRVKVNRILASAKASPSKTVGGLSPRQRDEILRLSGRGRTPRPPASAPVPALRVHARCGCGTRLRVPTVEGVCGLCAGER